MAFDYDVAAATALRLLTNFGTDFTLTRTALAAGDDPFDPGTETDTAYTVKGVLLDYDDRAMDGTIIRVGDRRAYIAASGLAVTPRIGDALTAVSEVYSVVNAKPLNPAGTAVVHELQVRRGAA